ncbi:MAG: aminopeptidase [Bacteroidetes bacterium]|nr:aminopeptidase [Bacteroidota bacterium]
MQKKTLFIGLFLLTGLFAWAQPLTNKKDSKYAFSVVKDVEKTDVKNQHRTGTCWSFSGLSFFESEIMRMGKGKHSLSQMYIVRHTYQDKADRFVRWNGHINFSAGGAFHDVSYVIKNYGIVPFEVYNGLNYGETKHMHGELDKVTKAYVDAVVSNPNRRLSTAWKTGYNGILDAYLGAVPQKFTYQGKEYTPKTYAQSLGINPDDYIELTSYSHQPYYESFVLEVPDNWLHGRVYNVPLEDLKRIAFHALDNNYSIGWAADVGETGFSWKNGLALMPKKSWDEMSKEEKEEVWNSPVAQATITPEMRQEAYDRYETTDDHGMHITGYVKDQNGDRYFIVKNSWGSDSNECDGYLYASEPYFLYKTMDIMIHKDALPKDIRKKLGL